MGIRHKVKHKMGSMRVGFNAGFHNPITFDKRIGDPIKLQQVTVKNCIVCGKEHTHNNAYCSAGCCKLNK